MTLPSHAVVAAAVFTAPLVAIGIPWWVLLPVALWYGWDAIQPDYKTWRAWKVWLHSEPKYRWLMYPHNHDEMWFTKLGRKFWRWGYLLHLRLDKWFHGAQLPRTGVKAFIGMREERWDDVVGSVFGKPVERWMLLWAEREAMVLFCAAYIQFFAWVIR